MCLADECRNETISGRPNTEHSCLSPAQEEQAQLHRTSDKNMEEDQSHNNVDQHTPDVSTTHRNRTGLHENEQKDMTTQGRYPQMRISDPFDTEYNRIPPVHNEQSKLSSTSGINLPESQSHSNKDPQHVNTTHENEEKDKSNQCGYQKQGKDNASQLNGCNTDYGPHLNPDILENIIKTTVGRYPQKRQTLRAVSSFFQRRVDTLPLPQVYIPELAEVANICHLSVGKIINMKGKNSGAVNALRNIINAKNWTNAWVSLVAYGYGWYGISKIYWRTRNYERPDLVHFSSEFSLVTV